MVLQPLEFTECFLDSPEFRDNLHSHEAELERTNKAIKELIRSGKALVEAAKSKFSYSYSTVVSEDTAVTTVVTTMHYDHTSVVFRTFSA